MVKWPFDSHVMGEGQRDEMEDSSKETTGTECLEMNIIVEATCLSICVSRCHDVRKCKVLEKVYV